MFPLIYTNINLSYLVVLLRLSSDENCLRDKIKDPSPLNIICSPRIEVVACSADNKLGIHIKFLQMTKSAV